MTSSPERSERGHAVIARVFAATREELARGGYRALRIDDVAAGAGVHKTTIYRRWPTKALLVRDALVALDPGGTKYADRDLGSVRAELTELGRDLATFLATTEGFGVFRMLVAEADEPELAGLLEQVREAKAERPRAIVRRAIGRGELPEGRRSFLLVDLLLGAVFHKHCLRHEPVDAVYVADLVALLLDGVAPATGRKSAVLRRRRA